MASLMSSTEDLRNTIFSRTKTFLDSRKKATTPQLDEANSKGSEKKDQL